MKLSNPFRLLTKGEWTLYILSLIVVTSSFFLGEPGQPLSLLASQIGVTALIFVAKGHVLGQVLTIVFGLLYAVITYEFHYYGEVITYLGMTAPIAAMSVVTWIRHPYEKGKSEIAVARLSSVNKLVMAALTAVVTTVFYFILATFGTANLAVSTVSIATSFIAAYCSLFRSPAYALAYAVNDVILIILWVLATLDNPSYLPMIGCFLMFLCNDIYGFVNWNRMHKRQQEGSCVE